MDTSKFPRLTIPLSPLMNPNSSKPIPGKRLRPEDSLHLSLLNNALKSSTLLTLNLNEKPWSVISVLSPYTPLLHVMMMETGSHRYLPSLELIEYKEGVALVSVFSEILDFIAKKDKTETVCWGYNWSPRSWGFQEEKTGFQSIPTKWHTMIWGWPSFSNDSLNPYLSFISGDSLTRQQNRLIRNNSYGKVLGSIIKNRLQQFLFRQSRFPALLSPSNWTPDNRGLSISLEISISEFFHNHELFTHFLKPVAQILDKLMADLTESFTTMNCSKTNQLLLFIEKRKLTSSELLLLRKTPSLKSKDQTKSAFERHGFPAELYDILLDPIQNRCREQGEPENWWRKGFGYALAIHGNPRESFLEIRIMPGVFNGPGGIVEALGVILQRPENREMPLTEIISTSDSLWKLAEELKSNFSVI